MTWTSKTGWTFAGLYLLITAWAYGQAVTCHTMFCDFVALYGFLPAGALYVVAYPFVDRWFGFGYIVNPHLTLGFVIPAIITNVLLYYFIGRAVAWTVSRCRRGGSS